MTLTSNSSPPQWSTEVPDTSRPNERGNIRRNFSPLTSPTLAYDGCQTLYEVLRRGRLISPLGPCLGFRAVSTSGFATPYVYSSYGEVVARVDALAAGLDRLGLMRERNEDGMALLGIYMRNCMEWILAEQACYALGGSTVPFYDTLGPTTVQYILSHTSTPAVVCSRSELASLCEAKSTGLAPSFRHVILVDGVIPEASRMAQEAGLDVVSLAKVEAVGAQVIATEGHRHSPPSGRDVATFCYTSGTTGDPKGALITHANLVSAIAGIRTTGFDAQPSDRHISYLPLPHIFERAVLNTMLGAGASVGFFRGDPLLLIEDIVALRPTILPAAPRVLNKIHDKVKAGITTAGGMKKKLFDAALATKTANLLENGQLTHAIYDKLIFNKIKAALGMDHIRFLVSGSAPLSDSVMIFFRCLLGAPVVEGYGQTEGAAAATVSHPDDQKTVGHVGGPAGGTEVVLVDVAEMGYRHTDTSHNGKPCKGRGEICIRGPNVFKGYYKDEEKTREAIDDEGWLHSGDIGLWTTEGQLQIIDRKKNIFKLAQGEYVAAEKIENVLIRSHFVTQCFVYGDSFQSCLVAVVVPDEDMVRKWALDIDSSTLGKLRIEELCSNEQLYNEIMTEIKALSKSNGLHGFETVRAFHLEPNQFTVESGLVTPTFKLKRQQLKEHYQKQIDEMYANMPPVGSKL